MQLEELLTRLSKNKEERVFACSESVWLFSLIYFTKYHHFPMPYFHGGMYEDLLFDDIIGALWIMFRESAKTSLAKIKIIHNIVYKKKMFNIWTSYDQLKAEGNLFDVALELQTNKNLIADFGQLFYEQKLTERKSTRKSMGEFVTANNIKVKAYSTGQSPRGEVFGEYRPDFIVLDDIETLKTIVSEPRTKQVIDYVDELFSGLSGSANTLILANRLTNSGSVAYIENKIKNDPKWKVRDVKVIEDNKLTWPDKYAVSDKEADEFNQGIEDSNKKKVSLETKRRLLGETVYNREMMNTPLTEDEREIKWAWLQKTFNPELIKDKLVNRYATIDVADTKEREIRKSKGIPDYTGIIVADWDIENNWYIQYAKRERINLPELIDKIFWVWETFKPIKIGVEKKSFEDQVKPYISLKSEETGIYPIVQELEHGGVRKEDRIRGALQGRLESGKVSFSDKPTDDTDGLKQELYDFPKAEFDDLSDALAYINQIGVRPIIKDNPEMMTELQREFFEKKKGGMKSTASSINKL